MKASVSPTDMLKLFSSELVFLQLMNSMISGWSTRRMAILAPLLVPPCLTCSVAVLKIFMKETGPDAIPPVVPTMLFLGLNLENEKPVPPPDL